MQSSILFLDFCFSPKTFVFCSTHTHIFHKYIFHKIIIHIFHLLNPWNAEQERQVSFFTTANVFLAVSSCNLYSFYSIKMYFMLFGS